MSEVTGTTGTESPSGAVTEQHPQTAGFESSPAEPQPTTQVDANPPGMGGPTLPPGGPPGWPTAGWWSPPPPSRLSRLGRSAVVAWLVAAVLAMTVVGLSVALALSGNSAPSRAAVPFPAPRTVPALPGGIPGPSQFPGQLAVIGTVASVGTNQFTVNALSGGTVTVNEQSSTTYYTGRTTASSSSVTTGARVVVQGSRTGDTVTATRVIVLGTGAFGGTGGPGGL
jgi:hypothetical protein